MRNSIREQLLVSLLVMMAALFVFRVGLAYFQLQDLSTSIFDEELVNTADSLAARLDYSTGKARLEIPAEANEIFTHKNKDLLFYGLFDQNGEWIIGDKQLKTLDLSQLPFDKGQFIKLSGQNFRIIRTNIKIPELQSHSVMVVSAESVNARQEFVNANIIPIIVNQLIVAIGSIVMVWVFIAKSLRPLSVLEKRISERQADDISILQDINTPSEVKPLLKAFNTMCLRVQEHLNLKERFISNAAHQLRTPVAALKTYSSYGCSLHEASDLLQIVTKIDSGLDVLTRLINQLLTLTRMQSADIRTKFQELDLNIIVYEMVSLLENAASNKEQNLHFEQSTNEASLLGEAYCLEQLAANLIDNAIQYAPTKSDIFVSVTSTEQVCLTVEDSGPGIPVEEREKVLDRFYRIPGASGKGSGLGLSIVKEVASMHNASISIAKSDRGNGTLVKVSFPTTKSCKLLEKSS